jgi:DNA repair protein RecO (recombination protein O)
MNDLQKAFVLHSRAYLETSALVDLLTQQSGHVCVIAKGARAAKSSWKGLLQLFVPLVVNWYGRGELPVLKTVEAYERSLYLTDRNAMLSGFYLNELLMRVLPRFDVCEGIFDLYEETVKHLNDLGSLQISLRRFEKELLRELGYELQLDEEANSRQKIKPDRKYIFSTKNDFYCLESVSRPDEIAIFKGRSLLAIAQDDYTDLEVLKDAKRLMRLAFRPLLGNKILKSRNLFV